MRPHLDVQARPAALSVAAACAIAAIALAVAMGIGRFAFTPLLPLMVRDGALAQSAGAWLAASNYLGYLAGALTASRLGLSPPALMRASLAGIVLATAAMGALDGLAAVDGPALRGGCFQRLGARLDQRVGVAASGAGGTHGSLRDGLRGRRTWNCACRAVLPRGRAPRRARQPALAGARNTCSTRDCGPQPSAEPAAGGLRRARFDALCPPARLARIPAS